MKEETKTHFVYSYVGIYVKKNPKEQKKQNCNYWITGRSSKTRSVTSHCSLGDGSVSVLILQAWRPKFNSWNPQEKMPAVVPGACNCNIKGVEADGSPWLAAWQPCFLSKSKASGREGPSLIKDGPCPRNKAWGCIHVNLPVCTLVHARVCARTHARTRDMSTVSYMTRRGRWVEESWLQRKTLKNKQVNRLPVSKKWATGIFNFKNTSYTRPSPLLNT